MQDIPTGRAVLHVAGDETDARGVLATVHVRASTRQSGSLQGLCLGLLQPEGLQVNQTNVNTQIRQEPVDSETDIYNIHIAHSK